MLYNTYMYFFYSNKYHFYVKFHDLNIFIESSLYNHCEQIVHFLQKSLNKGILNEKSDRNKLQINVIFRFQSNSNVLV